MTIDASSSSDTKLLRAHLLGSVRLSVGDRSVPDSVWSRRAARSLLLLLLVTPGHRLPRDRVLELLWPNASPDSADQSLRTAVHLLHRVLQPALRSGRDSVYLVVSADVLELRPEFVRLDADAFEDQLAMARAAAAPERRRLLRQALTLYEGHLLEDEPYVEWAAAPRERLRHLRRRAVLDLALLDAKHGEPASSVTELERLLHEDETDEPVLRALMQALAGAKRRDDAVRLYRQVTAALRDDLGVEPEQETRDLLQDIRSAASAASTPPAAMIQIRSPASVPAPPTPIIGRVREAERLQDLLLDRDIRLVTVTGTGGVGKTRLAQEVARQLGEDFADGVCFVGLAAVHDPLLVLPTIARALGLAESVRYPAEEVVSAALQGREMLLVLDNMEQVLDAAPHIAVLLERCDDLTILATSREPLRLRAEHEIPLLPLSVPEESRTSQPWIVARYDAVELFLRRAEAVREDFSLTDENSAVLVALCKQLDGLPLAIELAAAQIRTMSLDHLLGGLKDRFDLLAGGYRDLPPRQQSLKNTIAWSYDLQPPPRQTLFRALSVFSGGFSPDAVEEVLQHMEKGRGIAAPHPNARPSRFPHDIQALMESSLVIKTEGEESPRFSMMESIREYGLRELSVNGETEAARRAHAVWCLGLAERAAPNLKEASQAKWLDQLEVELDNIRAALAWSLEQPQAELALSVASTLRRFWLARGYLVEGRDWLERSLAMPGSGDPAIRVQGIFAAGELAFFLEDASRAMALAEEGLAICRSLEDASGAADALLGLGHLTRVAGDLRGAEIYLREGIALAQSVKNDNLLSMLQEALAHVAMEYGNLDLAEALFTDSLELDRLSGHVRGEASSLSGLAGVLSRRGEIERAMEIAEEALGLSRDLRDPFATATVLLKMGALLVTQGDLDRAEALFREGLEESWGNRLDALAAEFLLAIASLPHLDCERSTCLYAATEAFCRTVGHPLLDWWNDACQSCERALHISRSRSMYPDIWASAQALSPDEVIAVAVGERNA